MELTLKYLTGAFVYLLLSIGIGALVGRFLKCRELGE